MAESMAGIVRDKLVNSMGIQGHRDLHSKLGEMPKGSVLHPDCCPICLRSFHVCDCNDKWNNPEASKQTTGKLQWSLIPFKGLEDVVAVREFGAKKYKDPTSWKTVDRQKYLDAAIRHLVCVMNGEEIDSESGLPHIAHAQCNLIFISAIDKENKK